MSGSERTGRGTHKPGVAPGPPWPPDDRSPPELDEAVLDAARRAVRFHRLTHLLERAHLSPVAGWPLLAGIMLGAAICAGLDWLLGDDADPVPLGRIHARDSSTPSKREDVDRRSPTSWLGHIAALVRDGRFDDAESQLRAFRQSYPDYGEKEQ